MKTLFFLLFSVATATLSGQVKICNMSTRGYTGAGENVLIAGFITGEDGDYLIRVVGPGLKPYSIIEMCKDPKLAFFKGNQLIAENDDWGVQPTIADEGKKLGAFPLAEKDAAVIVHLKGNEGYTVHAKSDELGIVLIEIYPLRPTEKMMRNISSRGTIMPGQGQIIVGAIFRGSGKIQALWRAVGPTLQKYGVVNALPDPYLDIYYVDGPNNVKVAGNDNSDMADFIFEKMQAFPLPWGTKDAVVGGIFEIRADYVSFTYTGVASAAKGTPQQGVVLSELYFVNVP